MNVAWSRASMTCIGAVGSRGTAPAAGARSARTQYGNRQV